MAHNLSTRVRPSLKGPLVTRALEFRRALCKGHIDNLAMEPLAHALVASILGPPPTLLACGSAAGVYDTLEECPQVKLCTCGQRSAWFRALSRRK